MSIKHRRDCPICNGVSDGIAFPYRTIYSNIKYDYIKCKKCNSVYVDPVPDDSAFSLMYDKSNYHDKHYHDCDMGEYIKSVKLLKKYVKDNSSVLDYGCGMGLFLNALKEENLKPIGVEFDESAAKYVHEKSKCKVFTVDEFEKNPLEKYDCIHFGDVLEHLPDPYMTLTKTLRQLKNKGVLFVEGPLEVNPSLVYYSVILYGFIKNLFRMNQKTFHAPTHLFRTNSKQQLNFFNRNKDLSLIYWEVYETGWPYAQGGIIKKTISKIAVFLSGKDFYGYILGNRFRGIFIYSNKIIIKNK